MVQPGRSYSFFLPSERGSSITGNQSQTRIALSHCSLCERFTKAYGSTDLFLDLSKFFVTRISFIEVALIGCRNMSASDLHTG